MYRKFYKLKQLPFQLLPDPDFFYRSQKHETALTHLEYGIFQRAGFVVITGEIGAGKTTLLRYMLRSLDKKDIPVAIISQTFLHSEEFLQALCQEFSLTNEDKGKPELIELFGMFLVDQYRLGKYVILILDEAQNLPLETLEEIRMLSNLDADNERILQIILVGQPDLRAKLQSAELRQLYQRVEVSYHLSPLDKEELKAYIRYRIKTAGGQDLDLFDDKTIEKIYNYSGGVPRLINAVCHDCLVYGYADGKKKIDQDIVETVLGDRAKCGLFPPSDSVVNEEVPITSASKEAMSQEAQPAKNVLNTKLDHLIEISTLSTGAFDRLATNWAEMPNQEGVTDLKERLGNEQTTREALEKRLSQVETTLSQVNTDTSDLDPEKKLPAETEDVPIPPVSPDVNSIDEKRERGFDESVSNVNQQIVTPSSQGRKRFFIFAVIFIICLLSIAWARGWFSEDGNSSKVKLGTDGGEAMASNDTVGLPKNDDTTPRKNMTTDTSEPAASIEITNPYDLAKEELEKKNFAKVIELLERSKTDASYDPSVSNELYVVALKGQAKELLADDNLKEAETALLKVVELDPGSFETHFELGKLYTKMTEYPKAVSSYQDAIELNPEMAAAFYNLGFVFAKNSNYVSAEEALQQAAELKPAYTDKVLFNLAAVQLKLGKNEMSIKNVQKSIDLNPDNSRARKFLEKMLNNPGEKP